MAGTEGRTDGQKPGGRKATAPASATRAASALQPAGRPGRGRRPSNQVRQDIVRAAGALLMTEGMTGFTIERVALLAGASKMSIYKMWPSKGALALDGYFAAVEHTLAFPDTGDIEADLTAQLVEFVRLVVGTPAGRVVSELIGLSQSDSELAAAYRERYSSPRRALAVQALQHAAKRGDIRSDIDPQVVVDQLWGACYHRLLIPDEPLTEEFARAAVRNLMPGVRSYAT